MKVLYSAGSLALFYIPLGPFYFFFNGMLWMLFFMNIWWFHFIIWFIIRVARGDSRTVEDVREIPRQEKLSRASQKIVNGDIPQSGSLQSNGTKNREILLGHFVRGFCINKSHDLATLKCNTWDFVNTRNGKSRKEYVQLPSFKSKTYSKYGSC